MQIYLLLTESCNLDCKFCIRGEKKAGFIDVDKLQTVLKNNDFSAHHLFITGGEPSLHKELACIVKMCDSHFKGISINTNGVYSDWIEKIEQPNFDVQLSLDGTAEYHNLIRGNAQIDVFSKVESAIYKLNKQNIKYNISTTVGKSNYSDVKDLCKQMPLFKNMQYWKVSAKLPFGCANDADILSIEEWNCLVDYLIENAEVLLSIKKLFDFELLNERLKKGSSQMAPQKTNCGNVKYKVYIYPDFTVYPCTCLTGFPLGNLLENSLENIINNEKSKLFSNYQVSKNSACATCKYVEFCNGGCIGMSFHHFGKLGMGDFRCPLIMC